ncbi:MAG: hypothetical protein M1536_06525 [Firmicutes bacterium]|nr:hypothetical protein [Bacillota bacterium]
MENVKDAGNPANRYQWAALGDLNAFFGLMLDNVTNLVILTGILVGVFKFPVDVIYTKMIPGTAFGVLIGDIIYTWLAFRLARRTGHTKVTAMPLGLDTPSTIGIAFAVLGPCYLASHDAILTWKIGMATLVLIGIVKVIMSFFGDWIGRIVPQAGLLGSLAGIGLALLAFLPLIEIFSLPIVGVAALGLVLYALVARIRLPGHIPGAFAAVLLGTIIYYILGATGGLGKEFVLPKINLIVALPVPTLGFMDGLTQAINYLPLAIPFGILTIVGGINVTESARVAGDEYRTRSILLTEAIATLVAGVCGGVAQSTPYIGHPAYKKMGGRAAYTLATGLFIGIGGMFGFISAIVDILPVAAVAPILIFVGLEIISQAYHACPRHHAPAVTFAYLPIVAELVRIQTSTLMGALNAGVQSLPAGTAKSYMVITALGHGFILTAMLWGAILAFIIDRKFISAFVYLLITAVFTFFGVIHSAMPGGEIYLPWKLTAGMQSIPYNFTIAYLVFAVMILILNFLPKQVEENEVE